MNYNITESTDELIRIVRPFPTLEQISFWSVVRFIHGILNKDDRFEKCYRRLDKETIERLLRRLYHVNVLPLNVMKTDFSYGLLCHNYSLQNWEQLRNLKNVKPKDLAFSPFGRINQWETLEKIYPRLSDEEIFMYTAHYVIMHDYHRHFGTTMAQRDLFNKLRDQFVKNRVKIEKNQINETISDTSHNYPIQHETLSNKLIVRCFLPSARFTITLPHLGMCDSYDPTRGYVFDDVCLFNAYFVNEELFLDDYCARMQQLELLTFSLRLWPWCPTFVLTCLKFMLDRELPFLTQTDFLKFCSFIIQLDREPYHFGFLIPSAPIVLKQIINETYLMVKAMPFENVKEMINFLYKVFLTNDSALFEAVEGITTSAKYQESMNCLFYNHYLQEKYINMKTMDMIRFFKFLKLPLGNDPAHNYFFMCFELMEKSEKRLEAQHYEELLRQHQEKQPKKFKGFWKSLKFWK